MAKGGEDLGKLPVGTEIPIGTAPLGLNRDYAWQLRLDQLELELLTKIRAVAEKWAASLGAILGLLGTLLVVNGRDDVTALTDEYEEAVYLALGVAFAAGVLATLAAAYAAQGAPGTIKWATGEKLRRDELDSAKTARRFLRGSRFLALVAVLALATGVAITWVGEEDPASTSSFLVVPQTGEAACGKLRRDGDRVFVLTGDREVSLAGALRIRAATCPK